MFPEGAEGPEDYRTWHTPDLALVVTGQQHGYIEPCGCTGLDRQKVGWLGVSPSCEQLRERGWTLLPLDAGNQVRRFGRQAEVKLQQSVKALKAMDYQADRLRPRGYPSRRWRTAGRCRRRYARRHHVRFGQCRLDRSLIDAANEGDRAERSSGSASQAFSTRMHLRFRPATKFWSSRWSNRHARHSPN